MLEECIPGFHESDSPHSSGNPILIVIIIIIFLLLLLKNKQTGDVT